MCKWKQLCTNKRSEVQYSALELQYSALELQYSALELQYSALELQYSALELHSNLCKLCTFPGSNKHGFVDSKRV